MGDLAKPVTFGSFQSSPSAFSGTGRFPVRPSLSEAFAEQIQKRHLVQAMLKSSVKPRRRRPRSAARLLVELLETRTVPAVVDWASQVTPVNQAPFNDVLEGPQGSPQHGAQAVSLQQVQVSYATLPVSAALVKGNIHASSADVDWYSFTLANAATVTLTTFDQPGSDLVGAFGSQSPHLGPDERVLCRLTAGFRSFTAEVVNHRVQDPG
jgi:hypothetical protein